MAALLGLLRGAGRHRPIFAARAMSMTSSRASVGGSGRVARRAERTEPPFGNRATQFFAHRRVFALVRVGRVGDEDRAPTGSSGHVPPVVRDPYFFTIGRPL
jgi:hypothetical protein